MGPIEYRYGNDLDLDLVIDLYRDSTLGERRPVDDREIVEAMLRHAFTRHDSAWLLKAGDALGRRS